MACKLLKFCHSVISEKQSYTSATIMLGELYLVIWYQL